MVTTAEITEFQTLKDLKPILSSAGPCLSVYMTLSSASPAQSAKTNALEWKETLREVEASAGVYGDVGRELVRSISDWDEVLGGAEPKGRSIVVLRSPEVFVVSWVEQAVQSRAVMMPHFDIRPLLPELTRHKAFYVLALSQKDVRLLRCSSHDAEEVPFPDNVKTSYDRWLNMEKPDHTTDNMGTGGPSTGSMKGVMFTTSTAREEKDEFLSHFFRQIDRGLNELLRGKTEPVVLAGVEYELPLYRSVSTYDHLCEEAVRGAPNGLKSGELHARALDATLRAYEQKVDEVLAEWNHKVGSLASSRLKEVVTAAHDGRVLTLLVPESFERTGVFDEATHQVKGRETGTAADEDLINDAAVQTVLHAGNVYVVPNGKMPNGAPLAAIFRFAASASAGAA
jgi:hypothetical protein